MNEFQRKVILSKINDIDFNNEDDKLLKIIENSFIKIETGEKTRILFKPASAQNDTMYSGWNWVRYAEWIHCSCDNPVKLSIVDLDMIIDNAEFVGRLDKDKLIELLKY